MSNKSTHRSDRTGKTVRMHNDSDSHDRGHDHESIPGDSQNVPMSGASARAMLDIVKRLTGKLGTPAQCFADLDALVSTESDPQKILIPSMEGTRGSLYAVLTSEEGPKPSPTEEPLVKRFLLRPETLTDDEIDTVLDIIQTAFVIACEEGIHVPADCRIGSPGWLFRQDKNVFVRGINYPLHGDVHPFVWWQPVTNATIHGALESWGNFINKHGAQITPDGIEYNLFQSQSHESKDGNTDEPFAEQH